MEKWDKIIDEDIWPPNKDLHDLLHFFFALARYLINGSIIYSWNKHFERNFLVFKLETFRFPTRCRFHVYARSFTLRFVNYAKSLWSWKFLIAFELCWAVKWKTSKSVFAVNSGKGPETLIHQSECRYELGLGMARRRIVSHGLQETIFRFPLRLPWI